ncbi:hypothetical protein EV361DRAFT_807305 [Lentinula raphanica]|nr:hypothetical protein EV361DRAFT_807305 [Lentinula raphanica]
MPEYSDSFEFLKGVTLVRPFLVSLFPASRLREAFTDLVSWSKVLEPQLRIVKTRGGADDDIFKVPLHWHENHDEIITVLEGRLKVTLGKETKVYTPESGEAFVPRGVPHALESFKGEPCVVTERTNPSFDNKELFFRNILAIPGGLSSGGLIPMMQVFYYGDGYPVFPVHMPWLEKAFVKFFGGRLAPLLGHQLKYDSLKKVHA